MLQKTIMICAGGTGGHMFPALALAQDLKSRDYRVVIVTDTRTVHYTKDQGLDHVHVISSATIAGGMISKAKGAMALIKGYIQSYQLIQKHKPSLVIGFGGYPSMPPMIAAQRNDIPTVIHESNAVLGKANAFLAKKAERIALSLPEMSSIDDVDRPRVVVTGNPIRADIAGLYAHPYKTPEQDDPFHIAVMGGSLGAKVMADNVPQALSSLGDDLKSRLNIIQQCHEKDMPIVQEIYDKAGIAVTLKPFIDNVPEVLKQSHLIVARSGASTVSEIAVAGIPAIYVPYPHHADQQQKINAQTISRVGGAWVMEEKDLTPSSLAARIESLMRSPESLFKAAEAARSCAKPEATRKLGNLVIALVKGW